LAVSFSDLGDYKKSLEINKKVIDLAEEVLGEKHPVYLSYLSNMCLIYSNNGEYKKAIELDQKLVDLTKQTLGEHHPNYLLTLGYLANDYSNIGDYNKALNLFKRVVVEQKNKLGECHPDFKGMKRKAKKGMDRFSSSIDCGNTGWSQHNKLLR